jgi:hypothetical protein
MNWCAKRYVVIKKDAIVRTGRGDSQGNQRVTDGGLKVKVQLHEGTWTFQKAREHTSI